MTAPGFSCTRVDTLASCCRCRSVSGGRLGWKPDRVNASIAGNDESTFIGACQKTRPSSRSDDDSATHTRLCRTGMISRMWRADKPDRRPDANLAGDRHLAAYRVGTLLDCDQPESAAACSHCVHVEASAVVGHGQFEAVSRPRECDHQM